MPSSDLDPAALVRAVRALEAMPVRTRLIFIASQGEGLSFKDIARRERIALWRVRRHMRLAITIIDQHMR
jgi:DNA-directed RNA polymerase specialized sigma24 family protein